MPKLKENKKAFRTDYWLLYSFT